MWSVQQQQFEHFFIIIIQYSGLIISGGWPSGSADQSVELYQWTTLSAAGPAGQESLPQQGEGDNLWRREHQDTIHRDILPHPHIFRLGDNNWPAREEVVKPDW